MPERRGDTDRRPPEPSGTAGRRRWPWLVAAVGAAVFAAGVLVVLGDPGKRPDRAAAPDEPPVLPPVAAAAVTPSLGGASPPPPPDDPIADYKRRTRYAPSSGRLHDQAVDLLEPNRRFERPRPIEDTLGRGSSGLVTVHLEADKYYYWADETVSLALRVRRGSEVAPVTIRRAVAIAEGRQGQVGEARPLVFGRREGDPTAELRLERAFPDHHGPIQVAIDFEYEPGAIEQTSLRLFSTPVDAIPAAFTDRYADRLEGGNLVVDVGVDVAEGGFYRIDANLFSLGGVPVAFAHFKGSLSPGDQQVELPFFGLLLRDVGIEGPYEVRNVRGYLFRDGEYPDRLPMRDADRLFRTRGYDLAAFSDEEYTSPHKARMLQLLETDLAAGIGVDQPPAP